jgi:hypothetical protein
MQGVAPEPVEEIAEFVEKRLHRFAPERPRTSIMIVG